MISRLRQVNWRLCNNPALFDGSNFSENWTHIRNNKMPPKFPYDLNLTKVIILVKIHPYMNNHSYIKVNIMDTNLSTTVDELQAAQVAELFSALSDTSRVQILSALSQGEMNVGALAAAVGISQSAVSHHMRHLRQMRIVRARKDGRHVYYCLDDDHVRDLLRFGLEHVLHG